MKAGLILLRNVVGSMNKEYSKTWSFGEPAFDMESLRKCYILRVNGDGLPNSACYHDGAWVVKPFLRTHKKVIRFIPIDHPLTKMICKFYNISPKLPKNAFNLILSSKEEFKDD